ncbi:MAG: DUF1579 domain-containing protein [Planctomycetaceae bacterium]|nr:DUF1579 domain-containing protein [Planctomycetaceae bacterium]
MQLPTPQPEHEWLQQFVGDWAFEMEHAMVPDQPPEKLSGSNHVRSLDGLWILNEGCGDMPGGGKATSIITLGYDPAKQRFVGTFVASCMSHLWIYEGTLDADRKVLTLDTEGPSFTDEGKLAKYQDIFELPSPDHYILHSQTLQDDGSWNRFMTVHYHRTK